MNEYVILDFETTGLSSNDRIVQIGALSIRDSQIISEFNTLVNPCMPVSPKASEINHITDDLLVNAPIAEDVLPNLLSFIDNKPIIGHNIGFDLGVLCRELKRINMDYSEFLYCDTLDIAKKLVYDVDNYRLQTLCDYYDISIEKAHDALSDCKATFAISQKLFSLSPSLFSPMVFEYKELSNTKRLHRGNSYFNNDGSHFDISTLDTDVVNSITINKKSFVVTGVFDYTDSENSSNNRDDIENYILDNGGIIKKSIAKTKKNVDYVILGNNGWNQDKPSSKYLNAVLFNKSHEEKIIIIKEKDFFNALAQNSSQVKSEYLDITNQLREKYNMTGQDGEILVNCKELKNGDISYTVFKNLALKVIFKNNTIRLMLKSSLASSQKVDIGLKSFCDVNGDSDLKSIDFQPDEDIISYILSFLDIAIQDYDAPKEFGCCSRYKECSEKKECINPNKIRAKQCYYRDNLENGKVFY